MEADIFKTLDADGVARFVEWAKDHSPGESWSWATLHPVVRGTWAKDHRLCVHCGAPHAKCPDFFGHSKIEPPRSALLSWLNAANMGQHAATFHWSGSEGCWLGRVCGMTVGVEVDGYVHS